MANRRDFIKSVAAGVAAIGGGAALPRYAQAATDPVFGPRMMPSGALEYAVLEALPGKKPLIKRSYRPPNFETPTSYFNELYTPNDAFFVRYHLSNIPELNSADWKLKIGGDAAEKPFELTLAQLKKDFEQVEISAVCLCSGNRRGLSDPHVPGVEWAYGAMGNAKWKGVRLKDVLAKAGIKKEAVEVTLNGADSAVLDKTPDFVKSLPTWKAMDENTLLTYEMNGAPLPHLNGAPVRLVVPGWTATYWMKHIVEINAVSQPYKGFWMATAYRIPKGKFPVVDRFLTQETEVNTPITEMVVNSLITNLQEGQRYRHGQAVEIKGIAWDSGSGIRNVEVSTDGGMSWRNAELGKDVGRFSWRQWQYVFKPPKAGQYTVMAKASSRLGTTQTFDLIFNPAGYHNNVVQQIGFQVV